MAMVERIIQESGLDKGGYAVVLPMSSSEQDTAVHYTKVQFTELGSKHLYGLSCTKEQANDPAKVDSIVHARLIYITGAAVMSQMMITGNTLKDTAYSSTFRSIEADNIETRPGLGMLTKAIVDQHFVQRSRHNRLISAIIEYPDPYICAIKNISILVPESVVSQAVSDPRYMFTTVNQFLQSSGKPALFAVQLVGQAREVRLDGGLLDGKQCSTH